MTIPTFIKSFAKNTGGSVAIWAAFSTPVLVGGAALSVDASRLYNMDNELQSASDALARAGAAELDQRSDSLQRAKRAVQNLVSNDQKFAKTGKGKVEIDTIRFLKSIPENDYDPIRTRDITYDPSEAKFVEIKVKPENVATLFPTSLVKKVTDITLSAKSVAGLEASTCNVAPIFMCNPVEGKDETIYEAMETAEFRRRQIKLKTPGGRNSQYGPGNFGYVNIYGNQRSCGANDLSDAIAVDVSPVCMSNKSGIYLQPGNVASLRHGLNTRFDIYDGSFKKKRNDPRYAPAENVIKGYSRGRKVCSESPDRNALGMPRDTAYENGRVGNGNWDFVSYMKINHNYMRRITIEGITYRINYKKNKVSPTTPPSRYAMYRWEIDNNCVPGDITYGNGNTPEEGLPQCHTYGPSTTVEDRRIINVAILNCGEIEESGERMNGRTGPLPVETFVKVFLPEPMGKGKDNIIYGEIIGPVIQGQDAAANDKVALAR